MIISCSANKGVYWCGDHSCINKKEKEAYFKIMINPLVNWVWIGGIVIIFGALFAFWPSSRRNYGTI